MGFPALALWWELEELGGFEGSYIFGNVEDALLGYRCTVLQACSAELTGFLNKTLNKSTAEKLNQNFPEM